MPPRKNPLKLNDLQRRTLAIAQVLARETDAGQRDDTTGEIALRWLPDPHGNHFHVGPYALPARAASGLFNPAVWAALTRKGLARTDGPGPVTLTAAGVAYETGYEQAFERADH